MTKYQLREESPISGGRSCKLAPLFPGSPPFQPASSISMLVENRDTCFPRLVEEKQSGHVIQFQPLQYKQKSLLVASRKAFLKIELAVSFALCPSFFLLLPLVTNMMPEMKIPFDVENESPLNHAKLSSQLWKLTSRYPVAGSKHILPLFKPLFLGFSVACRQTHL